MEKDNPFFVAEPEADNFSAQKLKYFRQAYFLAKIFNELRITQGAEISPEGWVLLESRRYPEHMLNMMSTKEEISEYKNRRTDIIRESHTWLKVLEDEGVEIKYEMERYDLNHKIPEIDLDSTFSFLGAMEDANNKEGAELAESPFEEITGEYSPSSKTLLGKNHEYITLRRSRGGNTVETWSSTVTYNEDGRIIEESNIAPTIFADDSSICFNLISYYRVNLFSELQSHLNKAVKSETPEVYAAGLTPSLRKQILAFLLKEVSVNPNIDKVRDERDELQIYGKASSHHGAASPVVDYSRFRRSVVEGGVIIEENLWLTVDLSETAVAHPKNLPVPPGPHSSMGEFFSYSDKITKLVKLWSESRIKAVGNLRHEEELNLEIEKLIQTAKRNLGSINCQHRVMTLDPANGIYNYQFFMRSLSEEGIPVLEFHIGNPDDPSPDELATLMTLAI